MTSIAVITCVELPEPDPDQQPLLDALREAGMRAEMLPWDDPSRDASGFDLCLFRSCWNYPENADAFLEWVAKAETVSKLANAGSVVRRNIHKGYLGDLERSGVPVIPTAWVSRGETMNLHRVMESRGWRDVVIKPSVSAASYKTRRFRAGEVGAGQAFLDELSAERDVMIQRYIESVETVGERAVVWIDGEITHAVRKSPRYAGDDEVVSDAIPVTARDREIAQRALSLEDHDLLYARVDIVDESGGEPIVSEVELIEPSLFFVQCPEALRRFVGAVSRLAG